MSFTTRTFLIVTIFIFPTGCALLPPDMENAIANIGWKNPSNTTDKSRPKYVVGMREYEIARAGGQIKGETIKYGCGWGCTSGFISNDNGKYIYYFRGGQIDAVHSELELIKNKESQDKRMVDEKKRYEEDIKKNKLAIKSKVDVVAQVLNYSSGCKDLGCDSYTWIVKDAKQCIYEKISLTGNVNYGYAQFQQYVEALMAIESPSFGTQGSIKNIINLNEFDPKNIKITSKIKSKPLSSTKVDNWTSSGRYAPVTVIEDSSYQTQNIEYLGNIIFSGSNLDTNRLKRGWNLIYSQYCSGTKKEF